MTSKTKSTQYEDLEKPQGRDLFQTPAYASKLLIPFIPQDKKVVWECACGQGKITKVLTENKYDVLSTDLAFGEEYNFLTTNFPMDEVYKKNAVIITNPPFSLKRKFYDRCRFHGVPFALLIPADYSGWVIDALWKDGAEKIIPSRRIDYITPSGLSGATGNTSNFHSLWLTWGFGLGKTETFVELTNEMKKEI